ncbi:Equilibrative nucleoside transporter 4 [Nymphon striatum]|nr:Equilibrative nucleoside transporter 4 [Nymphon striatum]
MDEGLSLAYVQLGKAHWSVEGPGPETVFRRKSLKSHHMNVPRDPCNCIYFALVLAGAGFLLPYNSFIIAVDYFQARYPGTTIVFDMSLVYILMAFFAVTINNFLIESLSLHIRISFGYILAFFTLLFVAFFEIWFEAFEDSIAYNINLIAVAVVACGCTVQQSSFYGYTSMLPARYTQAVMTGESFKGHLTRAEKELDRICSFVEDNSSPRGISELETSFTKFKQAYSKLEILFDELIVSEIDDKVVDGYEGQLAEYSSKIDVYTKRVLHIIGGSRQVPNSQEGSTTSTIIRTDAPVYRPKICETLKPFKLNNVHTPVDLRNWIAKFKAFHSISNLELYTIEEQHMFLLSCVDPKLETTIVEHDNYNAELHLFGDDSVITILRDIFDLSFPLFNRRLEFFRYTQASGQKFSDFMLTLKQKGEDADLHSLDIDALYVFRYLTGLLTDASRLHGLGFCLIQHDKENNIRLISCGSCSLTPTQSRYATIELECLAIQWAIHKCEFWLRGICHFKVVTDHRPLVGVFNKPVYTIENPRLQRMCGKLTGYKLYKFFSLPNWTAY